MIELYTDGSSKANGMENNSGGFGVTAINKEDNKIIFMYQKKCELTTTNNKEELKALLYALKLSQTKYKEKECIIKSDSAYCVNMFNNWIYSWNKNGWVRGKNQPIENLELVKKIWEYCKIEWPNFSVEKTSGHNGILGNEIADALATFDEAKLVKILKNNNIEYDVEKIIDL